MNRTVGGTCNRWAQFEVFPDSMEQIRPARPDRVGVRQRRWDWKARVEELVPKGALGEQVANLEYVLRIGGSHSGYRHALMTLERLRASELLEASTERKVASLLSQFTPNSWDEV